MCCLNTTYNMYFTKQRTYKIIGVNWFNPLYFMHSQTQTQAVKKHLFLLLGLLGLNLAPGSWVWHMLRMWMICFKDLTSFWPVVGFTTDFPVSWFYFMFCCCCFCISYVLLNILTWMAVSSACYSFIALRSIIYQCLKETYSPLNAVSDWFPM